MFSNTGFESVVCAATFAANAHVIRIKRDRIDKLELEGPRLLPAPAELHFTRINLLAFKYRNHCIHLADLVNFTGLN